MTVIQEREVIVPSQKITRALPLNQLVTITVNTQGGEVAFACDMNMFKGAIVSK